MVSKYNANKKDNKSFDFIKENYDDSDRTPGYLVDKIYNVLIENGYDKDTKQNKYIIQIAEKFWYFKLGSDKVFFEICYPDFDEETILLVEEYTQDCKTPKEKYKKLNGIMTEVIAVLTKQAEHLIISQTVDSNEEWIKRSVNEIRESVSFKWKLVNGDVQSA